MILYTNVLPSINLCNVLSSFHMYFYFHCVSVLLLDFSFDVGYTAGQLLRAVCRCFDWFIETWKLLCSESARQTYKQTDDRERERERERETVRTTETAGVRISDVINTADVTQWGAAVDDWSGTDHVTSATCRRTPAAFAARLRHRLSTQSNVWLRRLAFMRRLQLQFDGRSTAYQISQSINQSINLYQLCTVRQGNVN